VILRTAGVLAAVALIVAAAPDKQVQPARTMRECFQLAAVSGYTHARNDRLYVHTDPRETYLFKTMGPCPELDFAENIALDPVTPGPICAGIDVDLIVPSTIGPHRCPVSMIRKLAPGEKEVH
jgi:hypothetical protein